MKSAGAEDELDMDLHKVCLSLMLHHSFDSLTMEAGQVQTALLSLALPGRVNNLSVNNLVPPSLVRRTQPQFASLLDLLVSRSRRFSSCTYRTSTAVRWSRLRYFGPTAPVQGLGPYKRVTILKRE
ncbi:hypothetical protein J3459_012585 [Metarhizium acridum]|nr:hypothetical protein J3459_012585 [Metarhizium acridum]